MKLSEFRKRALRIAHENPGLTGQEFAALVWPNGRMHAQGLARKGGGLLVKLGDEGLINRVNDGYRECVGRLTKAGRKALEE